MKFNKTVLPNGLRLVTIPMSGVASATVQIMVGAGTRHEEKRVNGLAHFLEHMVFKGTGKYPSAQAIAGAVDAVGADINAHTGKELTAYYIKAWEKYLALAFSILSGFIRDPLLATREIEKEKGVILEEIAMYEDLPMQKVPYLFEELLYGPKPLGWDVLGTRQTIPGVKKEDFEAYRRKFYFPQNMVLCVAGSFDKDRVLGLAEEYFGNLKTDVIADFNPRWRRMNSASTNPSHKPQIKLLEKKTEQAHLVLGVRGHPRGHPDRYKEATLAAILGGGMSSRLFTEIREKRGLAYYVKANVEHYKEAGYLAARAGVKLGAVEEAIKVILEEYGKVSRVQRVPRVSRAELQKAKEYLKGSLTLSLEDTHQVTDFFAEQELLEGRMLTLEEIMKGVDEVSLEDVRQLAVEFFQNSRLNLAIIGPYNDSERFEKLLRI